MKHFIYFFIAFILFPLSVNADDGDIFCKIDSVLTMIDSRRGIIIDSPVSCTDFESYYGTKGRMIKDQAVINELCGHLKLLEKTHTQRFQPRSKIYFFSSDTIIATACIDTRFCLIDGEMYVTSPLLLSYMDSISGLGTERTWYGVEREMDCIVSGIEHIQKFNDRHASLLHDIKRIRGFCHADTKGNVVKVKIITGRDTPIPSDIILDLETVIQRYLKWNVNKERNVADMIPFSIMLSN